MDVRSNFDLSRCGVRRRLGQLRQLEPTVPLRRPHPCRLERGIDAGRGRGVDVVAVGVCPIERIEVYRFAEVTGIGAVGPTNVGASRSVGAADRMGNASVVRVERAFGPVQSPLSGVFGVFSLHARIDAGGE